MGLFDALGFSKFKEGLAKTRSSLVEKVSSLITGRPSIDDEVIEQLNDILIAADVGLDTSAAIVDSIRRRVKEERHVHSSDLSGLLRDEIERQFPADGSPVNAVVPLAQLQRPHVILVVGINGVGKTTTIGKLAHRYISDGKRVVIAAADTFRAAANEQLEIWARRAGAEIVTQKRGSDPAAVAFDAVKAASSRNADVVIVDTAGRLHTKVNLMEELKKIKRVIQKQDPDAPHEVLLVIDASTGQNGLQQAKQFAAAVGVTGLVLTKIDGTAKGGIVLAITREVKIPVQYVGLGEKIDDLQPFNRHAFVEALFDQS